MKLSKIYLETSLKCDKGSMLGTNDIAHMDRIRSNASPVGIFVPVFSGRKKKQRKISAEMSRKRVFIIKLLTRTISMTSRTIAVLFMNSVNKISLELKAVTKTPYKIIHPVEGRRHKKHK